MLNYHRGATRLVGALLFALSSVFSLRAQALELNIYSATDTSAMQSILDGFSEKFPEIQVNNREFNTLELYNAILNGETQGADIFISSSVDLQVDLVNRGLAMTVDDISTDLIPDWANWRSELFGFTYEPVVVVYNKNAFETRQLPTTRSSLASAIRDDAKFYENTIGSYDIEISGVGYLFATQDIQRGYQFWRLVETLGRASLKTFCCTSDILDKVAVGELVLGYNVIGSYAIERAKQDPRIGVYALDDYTLVMSRSAFISKTAANSAAAKTFISYLISKEGQAQIAEKSALISISEASDGTSERLSFLGGGDAFQPIKIGPGLIGYLDRLKRSQVLKDWQAALGPNNPQ